MTGEDLRELAEILDAGWESEKMHQHMPAGDAVCVAVSAMARKAREIAARKEGA